MIDKLVDEGYENSQNDYQLNSRCSA